MWRPLLLHLLDLATVVATTSQCLERWGELRRYLLQSSLRERSVGDVSDDPLSSSTFFDPLLRTGARELKGMKWRRIRRRGVTDEVFTFVLGNGSSHFLAWVQVPHWRGQRKKIGEFGEGKRAIAGLASLADIFPIWPRFLPFPHHYGAWSQATQFFFVFCFLWEFCSPPSLVVIWVVPYFICIRSVWGWGSHRLQSWRFVASV